MQGNKILMVMSHPDDEILFGWPVFQDKSLVKTLLMCSTDENNPNRAWCSHRKSVLASVCEDNETKLITIAAPSDFYSLNPRRPAGLPADLIGDSQSPIRLFKDLVERVVSEMTSSGEFDCVFTHNPHGEYGHSDHKLVHSLVVKSSQKPVIYTDVSFPTNWDSCSRSSRYDSLYYSKRVSETLERDEDLFSRMRSKYVDAGVWTWSRDESVPRTCRLFELE